MTTTSSQKIDHSSTCRIVALECIEQNAAADGQSIPDWGITEEDPIPGWGVARAADLVDQYLSDGTSTCYCEGA